MATLGLFLACACTGAAQAQGPVFEAAGDAHALREYRSTTQHALIACGSSFSARRGWMGEANALGQYRGCVVKVRTEVAGKLDAAIRNLPTSDCARALRMYNAAFEKALLGIEPQPGETPLAYEQRQVFLFHTMAHAWGRFEVAESIAD
jgi:hypothetical protein